MTPQESFIARLRRHRERSRISLDEIVSETRIKREVKGVKRVIATGGLAALFEEDSEHIDETDSELTLKGLKIIWDRNRSVRRGRR